MEMSDTNVEVLRAIPEVYSSVLTPEALSFAVALQRNFNDRRVELLGLRVIRQSQIDKGEMPEFLSDTKHIRESDWTVAPLPTDLYDRRVEITGPPTRKMVINALNSGAKVFMADFEDSTTPTWENVLEGQLNLRDAIRRAIDFKDALTGKQYMLSSQPAVLFVRPRGWHLEEKHITVDGKAMSGALFDFALYFFHNAKELVQRGSGPYFYLPKLEGHLEARLWNDVFDYAEHALNVTGQPTRATVLIESILAAFEMDEILYELRSHSAGLNCGRWDYIFSYIKKFSADKTMALPDRSQIGMTSHFMRSYSLLCIETCHRRHVSAMGGMSALIPIKDDVAENERAMSMVRADKEREAGDGHDGTWVAHPGLVPIAMEVFNRFMPHANQIDKRLSGHQVSKEDLLRRPEGFISEAGVRQNIAVGLGYIEAWLRGIGCVPLFNLMEDAATAEISRAQLWQWVHHGATLNDGRVITDSFCSNIIEEELSRVASLVDVERKTAYDKAAVIMRELIDAPSFPEFLTLSAYDRVLADEKILSSA